MSDAPGWLDTARAVGRRPDLWRTALRQMRRTAEPGWWRRFPPFPLPPREYLQFRVQTQGGSGGLVQPCDVVNYLAWCKRWDGELRGDR